MITEGGGNDKPPVLMVETPADMIEMVIDLPLGHMERPAYLPGRKFVFAQKVHDMPPDRIEPFLRFRVRPILSFHSLLTMNKSSLQALTVNSIPESQGPRRTDPLPEEPFATIIRET